MYVLTPFRYFPIDIFLVYGHKLNKMAINPLNVLRLLQEAFDRPGYDFQSITTDEDISFAKSLESLIKDAIDDRIFCEVYDTLCYDDESVYPDPVIVDEELHDSEVFKNEGQTTTSNIDYDYKKKAVDYWLSGKNGKLSFQSVRHKFKRVTKIQTLYRWKEQIEQGGSRLDKLLLISKYVLDQFKNASDSSVSIHDFDLKKWALQAREKVGLSGELFTASSSWIYSFKIKHAIVSRKINKFVTKKQISTRDKTLLESQEFVSKIKSELLEVGAKNIYNTDQSGFNLETHAGRTLSFKGESKIECLAQSLNSLTHSYTIQPFISADGDLKSPLLIVMQETDGKFGPNVEKTLYRADNIVAFATKSGKLTSELAVKWFSDVFLPNVGNESILCLDSWSGQTEKHFEKIDKGTKKVKVFTIPAGTTGYIQPLDVYTFRPWKNFLRQFSDLIILYNYDVNLHLRNNVLKIQSLIHNQFSSPRFKNLFKYAWWKSGYISEKPEKCQTPAEFCLRGCEAYCQICNDMAIMQCAWCKKSLCIQHFFAVKEQNSPHYCVNFLQ